MTIRFERSLLQVNFYMSLALLYNSFDVFHFSKDHSSETRNYLSKKDIFSRNSINQSFALLFYHSNCIKGKIAYHFLCSFPDPVKYLSTFRNELFLPNTCFLNNLASMTISWFEASNSKVVPAPQIFQKHSCICMHVCIQQLCIRQKCKRAYYAIKERHERSI